MTTGAQAEKETMGRVVVDFKVANNRELQMAAGGALPQDQVRWFELQGVVDSGATLLVLPTDVADRLGFPRNGETRVRYGDHREAVRTIVDQVYVDLLGRHGTYRAILEPDRTTALIGAIILEDLDLMIDCKNQRLVPRDPEHTIYDMH